jgi:hypothetical protein
MKPPHLFLVFVLLGSVGIELGCGHSSDGHDAVSAGGRGGAAGKTGAGGLGGAPLCDTESQITMCGFVSFDGAKLSGCVLALGVAIPNPGLVAVFVDCAPVHPSGADAGAPFVVDQNAKTVTLTGDTCTRVRAGVGRVDVVLACP